MSDFILIFLLWFQFALFSESHTAQGVFNISEIRQPHNPRLAGSAEANGVRRGGNGWSCHLPAVFFPDSFLFVLF